MDIYFAGAQSDTSLQYMEELGANKLFSYANDMSGINELIEKKKAGQYKGKLLVDSGAFSAYTKGKKIDLDDYIAWINKVSPWVDYFIALDIIPGPGVDNYAVAEGGYRNYMYMLQNVNCPEKIWPVHHASDPDEYLYKILSTEILPGKLVPYICLGGLVGTNASVLPFLQSMEHKISKSCNPNVKVHALGVTSKPTMSNVNFTSCDSAAWIFCGSTGNIMTPWGNLLVSDRAMSDPQHLENLPEHRKKVYYDYIQSMGFTVEGVMTRYQDRMNLNIKYMYDSFTNMTHKKARFRKKVSEGAVEQEEKQECAVLPQECAVLPQVTEEKPVQPVNIQTECVVETVDKDSIIEKLTQQCDRYKQILSDIQKLLKEALEI